MKMSINFEKFNNFLRQRFYIIIAGIFLILFIVNIWVYYSYVYLSINSHSGIGIEEKTIDQDKMKQVIDNIELREENLKRVESQSYQSPFIN